MSEEFIDDIISSAPVVKTEAEIITELQGSSDTSKDILPELSKETPTTKSKESASDPVKELATQLGWREDHNGDDAVDAKTYILRSKDIQKSMSQHNKDLKEQLSSLGGSVEALKKHNESVYQAEVKKLADEVIALKKERRDAIELADIDKVDELDKQIEDKQKDLNAPKKVEHTKTENPAYDAWITDNQWYLKDDDMAKFADTVAQQYAGAPLDRVYAIVRTKVQEVFPDKFTEAKPPAQSNNPIGPKSPVEGSSTKMSGATFTKADLSPDQMQIMKQFVSMGIMSEEAYVADIAKTL